MKGWRLYDGGRHREGKWKALEGVYPKSERVFPPHFAVETRASVQALLLRREQERERERETPLSIKLAD